ncbi:MAG: hypothetical protein ACYDED_01400 [Ferrimicrobium sp.]
MNKVPWAIGVLVALTLAAVIVFVGGAFAQNGSLGGSSWKRPAVAQSANGYAGAPVGSPIYRSQP